ncbi:MAG: hypothetical protein PVI06_02115 [Desulfobacterales bacterium]|jgi:hypothetical protein
MQQKEAISHPAPVYKQITIKTSDGATIQGKVNLTSKERVSDLFTKSESPFIVLVDAILREGQGKILILNKEHIVWVEPEED